MTREETRKCVATVNAPADGLSAERALELAREEELRAARLMSDESGHENESWLLHQIAAHKERATYFRAYADQLATIWQHEETIARSTTHNSELRDEIREVLTRCRTAESNLADRDRTIERLMRGQKANEKKQKVDVERLAQELEKQKQTSAAWARLNAETVAVLRAALTDPATGIPRVAINSLDLAKEAVRLLSSAEERVDDSQRTQGPVPNGD